MRRWPLALAWILYLLVATSAVGSADQAGRFELYSDPCVNLHHFLYHSARNELRGEEKLRWRVRTYPEDRSVALDGAQAEAWRRALEIYAGYADRSLLFSPELTRVKNDCAWRRDAFEEGREDEPAYEAIRIAMPVYRRHWWPRHDAINRKRMAEMTGYLAQYEDGMAERLARDYESEWPDQPIRVDLSVYSGHHGAYATNEPNQIVFASAEDWYPGLLGLEILFHEAGHTMPLGRHVQQYSSAAAEAAGVDEDDLWHAYFFYAPEQAAKEVFPEGYTTYPETYGLWDGGFGQHRPFLEKAVSPERSLAEEMRAIHGARAAAR